MWNVNLQRYLTSVDLYDCVSLGVDKGLMGLCNERWVDEFVEAGRYFYQSKEFISRLAAFDTAVEECMEEGVK